MATIKEVADQAGVSVATVSRVLNNTGFVSEDLSKRVREAAENLNYRPSRVAKNLRRQKTDTVGVLVPQLDQPFFSRLTFAIQQMLVERDYYTLVCSTMENLEEEYAYVEKMLEQRVDGMIIVPTGSNAENIERLLTEDVPVVLVDRDVPDIEEIDRVICDNYGGAYRAIQHLLGLGHERIGVIGGPAYSQAIKERLRGVRQALEDAGVRYDVDQFITGGLPQFDLGVTATTELLQQSPRPTAIFALSDITAVGALHAAYELGLEPPYDLSVMGFDNIPLAAYSLPELTTVSQPIDEMGKRASELLISRMADRTIPMRRLVLETELIERKSTAPLRR